MCANTGVAISWNSPASVCAMLPVKCQTMSAAPTLCRYREYFFSPRKCGKEVYSQPQFMPTYRSRCISGRAQNSSSHSGRSALYSTGLLSVSVMPFPVSP